MQILWVCICMFISLYLYGLWNFYRIMYIMLSENMCFWLIDFDWLSRAISEIFIEHLRWLLLYSVWILSILAMIILILILEDSMWLQLIYFSNTISFWFVECFFRLMGHLHWLFQRVTEFTLFPLWLKSAIMESSRHCIN